MKALNMLYQMRYGSFLSSRRQGYHTSYGRGETELLYDTKYSNTFGEIILFRVNYTSKGVGSLVVFFDANGAKILMDTSQVL